MHTSLAGRARAALRAAGFGLWTAGMVTGAELAELTVAPPERPAVFDRWLRRWAGGLLSLFGVDLRVGGAPVLPATGARLVVSNHRSPVDVAVLLSVFGGQILSRADLERWPIVGRAARKARTIFVDRDSRASGVAAVRLIRQRLQAGATVTIFPEGTTFAGDEIRPFRAGAFVAARNLPVELLPVALAYEPGTEFIEDSFLDHLGRVAARPTLRVGLAAGTPLAPGGTVHETTERLRHEVERLVPEARRLVDRDA